MPLFFWGDPDGERLRESYFSMYPGVWRHGDWIRITPRGGAVIYGRSDATINRQGVRMGTSEIYRAASAVEEVVDALVVDIPARRRAGAHDGAADVAVRGAAARGRSWTRAGAQRSSGASARTARRGTCRTGAADRGGAAHALGQGARGAGEADPDGRRAGGDRERRLAREPGRARLLRARSRRRCAECSRREPRARQVRAERGGERLRRCAEDPSRRGRSPRHGRRTRGP